MKNQIKLSLIAVLVPVAFVIAQEEKRMPPPEFNLTAEQKTCLESILGKKGEGKRPSREVMEKALSTCGIDKSSFPPPPRHRHHHQDEDSDQQESSQNDQGSSQGANK